MSTHPHCAELDLSPPQEVADARKRAGAAAGQFGRGSTQIGVARARDLKNRRNLSPDTIKRMVSYFARGKVDKRAPNFGNEDNPSAGYIAWLLWGGDAGRDWFETLKAKMEKAD